MILPIAVLLFVVTVVTLYRQLAARRDRGTLWRSAIWIGLTIGLARAALACIGWFGVEHTGGPLQIPAYALAMLALPEAVVLRQPGFLAATAAFYVALAVTLVGTSLLFVILIALALDRR